nr:hypothetical protein [Shimia thalassica]
MFLEDNSKAYAFGRQGKGWAKPVQANPDHQPGDDHVDPVPRQKRAKALILDKGQTEPRHQRKRDAKERAPQRHAQAAIPVRRKLCHQGRGRDHDHQVGDALKDAAEQHDRQSGQGGLPQRDSPTKKKRGDNRAPQTRSCNKNSCRHAQHRPYGAD